MWAKLRNILKQETCLLPKVRSSILNWELSQSFSPSAPEICSLLQQFTISESVTAAAVDVISQPSKRVGVFPPCWFQSTLWNWDVLRISDLNPPVLAYMEITRTQLVFELLIRSWHIFGKKNRDCWLPEWFLNIWNKPLPIYILLLSTQMEMNLKTLVEWKHLCPRWNTWNDRRTSEHRGLFLEVRPPLSWVNALVFVIQPDKYDASYVPCYPELFAGGT